jgi:3-oxoacyl-[acyl-carrier-protein] synthase II
VSGTKGLYGHALGASGAVEAAITALAIDRGILPGTCNLAELDAEIGLTVLATARECRIDAALTNSFGFGGMNAALVLSRA